MSVNFFDIPNFDRAFILARKSNKTLPGSVRDNLSDKEEERLLEIIEEFEKSPRDLQAKREKYSELMKLFYKGIGLDEKGKGTISEKDRRAAFELSALISDAILQDQQNIRKAYNYDELNEALKLQNEFRKDLENTDFKELLTAKGNSYTELSEGQKEYQTEKITSYLAENKEDFTKIFQELSKEKPDLTKLTEAQKEKLKNLKTLAGKNGQKILNDILHTFKEFKDYSFSDVSLRRMKSTPGELLEQAVPENISPNDNWERLSTPHDDRSSNQDNDRSSGSSRESREIRKILERILARLEKIDPNGDNRYSNANNRGNRWNNNSNNCNCSNCNGGNNCNCNNGNNGNNGNNDIPSWARDIGLGLNLAGQFLNITGLGNRGGGCYSPAPCYGGGSPGPCPPSPCPPTPYYVGGNTWPWGEVNGINGQYGAFNNYMPSSGSSNPYSSSSAYNPISISVNPVFNNNPYVASNSSANNSIRFSSNGYNLRRCFT